LHGWPPWIEGEKLKRGDVIIDKQRRNIKSGAAKAPLPAMN
jgi:hypothetical protein